MNENIEWHWMQIEVTSDLIELDFNSTKFNSTIGLKKLKNWNTNWWKRYWKSACEYDVGERNFKKK